MKTNELVRSSLIAGLMFICLTFIKISGPNIVISLGFCVVFATGIVFGAKIAGIGCGIGAMLFDLSAGYVTYAPFTLVAYGLSAFVVGLLLYKEFTPVKIVLAVILATLIKQLVYFIANYIFFGTPTAVSNIPLEFINCGLGIVLGIPLGKFLKGVIKR